MKERRKRIEGRRKKKYSTWKLIRYDNSLINIKETNAFGMEAERQAQEG